MVGRTEVTVAASPDRAEMLKAFDETQAGVKGLIDSGVQKVPRIFVRSAEELAEETVHQKIQLELPVIDFSGISDPGRRKDIVDQVSIAAEKWGVFQAVNHGIPVSVLDGMIDGVCTFNEQGVEEKRKYYSRDQTRSVKFNSNFDLFAETTPRWRDTLSVSFADPDQNIREQLPPCCRDSTMEYANRVEGLGNTVLGLLSESLGLKTDHLKDMECSVERRFHCHYYPACPEPELTIGTKKHTDSGSLTILLQNQVTSGLQALYDDKWVDVNPIPGGLVVIIGDLLQVLSNGKFKSVEHRAASNLVGPRISVACFFSGPTNRAKLYGPIKELISEENPAVYREIMFSDHVMKFLTKGHDDHALDHYKL